ncbi:Putative nucleotidyltransferase substrate binding domain protein [Corynebacterium atrinae]|uniref:putative nucleotidyltransferase substrate binding domain-containing protein n=1 Tax=Corynebacterium atrinae TaxID=1336740 RepID=UPI0025B5EC92|nr:putative nucleotidyltransferase substrate binding domain-containing protein [Corynebacterium atrinae]WJY62809.1 Putative nucleotidyltransferase substrate binding domain protein [Corynebacterium atrinae]
MLHPSLIDLTEQARTSRSPAMVRGVLAESHDLLRNAISHQEPVGELTAWYSRTILETLASPAVESFLAGETVRPIGALARLEALPTDPIGWIPLDSSSANSALTELFLDAGLPVDGPQDAASVTDADGMLIDAHLLPTLLERAIARRPPALRLTEGRPDYDAHVNIQATLMSPAVDVARWAGLLASSTESTTRARLGDAHRLDILTADEADSLTQAWTTGAALEMGRWYEHLSGPTTALAHLSAVDRSAYSAAARLLAGALRSLAARHDIPLTDSQGQ